MKVQAEAQANATRINGQADGDAIKARGLAEADAVKAKAMAEAAGIESRAAALSQNQEAVIAQQIAVSMPDIVRAAASPFEHVGQFTVLNGAQGVTSALGDVIQQAGALVNIARRTITPLLGTDGQPTNGDGAAARPKPAATAATGPASARRPARVPDAPRAADAPAAPDAPKG